MDKNLVAVNRKMIERTVKALERHDISAEYVQDKDSLMQRLADFLPRGASCSVGGSMTLFETGVIDYLHSRSDLTFYDRYAADADKDLVYRQAFSCDVYFMSSNAITEDGKLYNMDGNGNRVAALAYGPQKVVIIAGANKIVADVEAARERNRRIAAPVNVARLSCKTPCLKQGICSDCNTPDRICRFEVITHGSRYPDRLHVLILPDEYGY